jgi:hypothetical protein
VPGQQRDLARHHALLWPARPARGLGRPVGLCRQSCHDVLGHPAQIEIHRPAAAVEQPDAMRLVPVKAVQVVGMLLALNILAGANYLGK